MLDKIWRIWAHYCTWIYRISNLILDNDDIELLSDKS